MSKIQFLALALAQGVFAAGVQVVGKVVDAKGAAIPDAVVELAEPDALLPRSDTLSDAAGRFGFEFDAVGVRRDRRISSGSRELFVPRKGDLRLEVRGLDGRVIAQRSVWSESGAKRLEGLEALVPGGRKGVFLVRVEQEGRQLGSFLVGHAGRTRVEFRIGSSVSIAAARAAEASSTVSVQIRKTGFLPRKASVASATGLQDLGDLVLERDPLESRIDSVLALMNLDDKIGQMTQGLIGEKSPTSGSAELAKLRLGSLLSGGGDPLPDYAALQNVALSTPRRIPMIYGIDAVHGTAKARNATVFPHHIGLGATRDSSVVRRIGEATAREMLATGTDWTFAPCIAVVRDDRWGRSYEGFGETPELAVELGVAEIRGLQGGGEPWNVIACAKHFVADGGTTYGTGTQKTPLDQGDARIGMEELRKTHLPGYVAAVRAGVGTVMASYSLVDGVRNHANKDLLTGVLKTELGFDGFVVSDWLAIGQIEDSTRYKEAVRRAVLAGIDMAMEPNSHAKFITTLKSLVSEGAVAQDRIDDAVRRILRVKFRSGRMDAPFLPEFTVNPVGVARHREVGREAVRKSLVVLKNQEVGGKATLPLAATGNIAVHGSHADNGGLQCGGWTLSWQGAAGEVPGATTILAGMRQVLGTGRIVTGSNAISGAAAAVFVVGERPYAEMQGDLTETNFADFVLDAPTASLMAMYRQSGVPVITVFISGRARPVPTLLTASDAFVAAWLPGSEGAGVADVLSGAYAPTGTLPVSWPLDASQATVNVGDGKTPAFAYGFGLTW